MPCKMRKEYLYILTGTEKSKNTLTFINSVVLRLHSVSYPILLDSLMVKLQTVNLSDTGSSPVLTVNKRKYSMSDRFDLSFDRVVGHEGGLSLDRNDRGNWTSGKIGVGSLNGTKYGVSAMAYPSYDIRNLTLQDAKDIYRRDYWNKLRCDDLPIGIDYLTFDSGVNHGNSRAAKFLQTAVGASADGIIGEKTVAKVNAEDDIIKVCSEFCVTRGLFYTEIGTFQQYKLGWFRRLFDTHATAVSELTEGYVVDNAEHVSKAAVDEEATDKEKSFWNEVVALSENLSDLVNRKQNDL